MCAKLLQLYLTLCNPMDYSPPGSVVHGILQAGILEWVSIPPPGDLPNPGINSASLMSPALAGRFFSTSTMWEALWSECIYIIYLNSFLCAVMLYTWCTVIYLVLFNRYTYSWFTSLCSGNQYNIVKQLYSNYKIITEGEGGMIWENSTETYTLPNVKQIARGSVMCDAGHPKPGLCDHLEGWSGRGHLCA